MGAVRLGPWSDTNPFCLNLGLRCEGPVGRVSKESPLVQSCVPWGPVLGCTLSEIAPEVFRLRESVNCGLLMTAHYSRVVSLCLHLLGASPFSHEHSDPALSELYMTSDGDVNPSAGLHNNSDTTLHLGSSANTTISLFICSFLEWRRKDRWWTAPVVWEGTDVDWRHTESKRCFHAFLLWHPWRVRDLNDNVISGGRLPHSLPSPEVSLKRALR